MSNVIKAKRGPALNTGPHTIELCIRDFVLQPLVCHVCHTKSLLVGYASDQRQPNERFSVSQRRACSLVPTHRERLQAYTLVEFNHGPLLPMPVIRHHVVLL